MIPLLLPWFFFGLSLLFTAFTQVMLDWTSKPFWQKIYDFSRRLTFIVGIIAILVPKTYFIGKIIGWWN